MEKLRLHLLKQSWCYIKGGEGDGEDIQRGYLATVEERQEIGKAPKKLWEQFRHRAMGSQVKAVRLGKQKEQSRKIIFQKKSV